MIDYNLALDYFIGDNKGFLVVIGMIRSLEVVKSFTNRQSMKLLMYPKPSGTTETSVGHNRRRGM